jgi:hypothetical protein
MRIVIPRNHMLEEFVRIHTMSGIMRTGVDAAWLGVLGAKIAGRGLLLGNHRAVARRIGILDIHFERMQCDVAIRAILGAQPTSDAPVFNDDFERLATPYGTHRTTDHAQRITALAAGRRDQEVLET